MDPLIAKSYVVSPLNSKFLHRDMVPSQTGVVQYPSPTSDHVVISDEALRLLQAENVASVTTNGNGSGTLPPDPPETTLGNGSGSLPPDPPKKPCSQETSY